MDSLGYLLTAIIVWLVLREARIMGQGWLKHVESEADLDRQLKHDLLEAEQTGKLELLEAQAEAERDVADKWSETGARVSRSNNPRSDEPDGAVNMEIPVEDYRTP